MRLLIPLLALAAPLLPAAAQERSDTYAVALIERALRAAGGADSLDAIVATRSELYTAIFAVGAERHPGAPPTMDMQSGVQVRDFAGSRLVVTGTHRHGAATTPLRIVATTTAGYEFSSGYFGGAGPRWAEQAVRDLAFAPERILLTARATSCRIAAGNAAVRCDGTGGAFTLTFDAITGHLATYEVDAPDQDVPWRRRVTRFADHHPVFDGAGRPTSVVLPHLIRLEVDGVVRRVTQLGRVETIAPPADSLFAIPDSLRARATTTSVPPLTITTVGEGLHRVGAGVYYALAVVQGDSIVLLEAPEGRRLTRRVLDTLRVAFPRTPVRLVVNSHAHGDHSDGLAIVFAAGIPVVTHVGNVAYLRSLGSASARIIGVRDSLTVGRGPDEIRLYAAPNVDADTYLLGYLPRGRVVWATDVAEGAPSATLSAMVQRLGLDVARVVPGHGRVWDWR